MRACKINASYAAGSGRRVPTPAQYAKSGLNVAQEQPKELQPSPLVRILTPKSSERILDVGCGEGALTKEVMACGATVIGIDANSAAVASARCCGVSARVVDAHELMDCNCSQFHDAFDAAITRGALHFMRIDPVLAGVNKALHDHGRFVGETNGFGDFASVRIALCAALDEAGLPHFDSDKLVGNLLTKEEMVKHLVRHDFVVKEIVTASEHLIWDDKDFTELLVKMTKHISDEGVRVAVRKRATELAAPALRDSKGSWHIERMRLRFVAKKR